MRQLDAIRGDANTFVVVILTFAPVRDRPHGPHGQQCEPFHPGAPRLAPCAANG